jgi:hypothetical protein
MKVFVPEHFILTAKCLAKGKTPAVRTKGFQEQAGQERGAGDVADTVGCFAMFQYLVGFGLPTEYHLTALQGDETDLTVTLAAGKVSLNVKTSSWQPKDDAPEKHCHLAIKESEFDKVSDYYFQIMTHLSPENEKPHLHFCGGIAKEALDFKQWYGTIPNTGGSKGLWIPASELKPVKELMNLSP